MLFRIYKLLAGKNLARFFPESFLKFIYNLGRKKVKIKVNGYTMKVFKHGDFDLILREKHEPMTTMIVKQLSKHFDIFIDVGARWGYFTLLSQSNTKIAIEPEKRNFELLTENVKKNMTPNTILVNSAVSDNSGKAKLFLEKKHSAHSLIQSNKTASGSIEIDTVTLDELLKPFYSHSMFFKIDVEGAENKVLQGMKELLKKEDIAIILEQLEHNQPLPSAIASMFKTMKIDKNNLLLIKKEEES